MQKPRLLFVDDDISIRETLPPILILHGFEVTVVASVREALVKINQEPFDILLSDLNVGEPGDGFTVVSAMRRLQPDARTFILTGYPDFASALEAIRRQVDDYLIKPMDVPTLLRTLTSQAQVRETHQCLGKLASAVIRENADSIIQNWFQETTKDQQFRQLRVPKNEFIDHLPDVLRQLADRLDNKPEVSQKRLESALAHGRTRRQQGASATLVIAESRILYRVIAACIQANLLHMDISAIIPDLILISETLNEMLSISLRSFLSPEPLAA